MAVPRFKVWILILLMVLQIGNAPPLKHGNFDHWWQKTPGDQYICTGDTATLYWEYDPKDFTGYDTIRALFLFKDGTTILHHNLENGDMKKKDGVYLYYSPGNITITLDITADDAGQYKLGLSGTTVTDFLQLHVYEQADLQPSLLINNEPHDFSSPIQLIEDETNIVVTTAQDLPANITISVNGVTKWSCTMVQACHYKPTAMLHNHTIHFDVNYGVCRSTCKQLLVIATSQVPATTVTTKQSEERNADRMPTGGEAGIVLGVVLGLLALFIVIRFYFRRHGVRKRQKVNPDSSTPTNNDSQPGATSTSVPAGASWSQSVTFPMSTNDESTDDDHGTVETNNMEQGQMSQAIAAADPQEEIPFTCVECGDKRAGDEEDEQDLDESGYNEKPDGMGFIGYSAILQDFTHQQPTS